MKKLLTVIAYLTSFSIMPVEAASFKMRFSGGLSQAEGVLQFEESNLTGIGKESATLRDFDPLNRGTFLFEYNYQKFDY